MSGVSELLIRVRTAALLGGSEGLVPRENTGNDARPWNKSGYLTCLLKGFAGIYRRPSWGLLGWVVLLQAGVVVEFGHGEVQRVEQVVHAHQDDTRWLVIRG